MLIRSSPPGSSTTWHSSVCRPTVPPSDQVAPWSSLKKTWENITGLPSTASRWSQGMTRRPASSPRASWMPTPGPVAYHVQPGALTDPVIVRGAAQVRPSSRLDVTRTSELSRQKVSQTVPVVASTTGQGFPIVTGRVPPSSWTRVVGPQVRPPSSLRRSRRSMSPWSAGPAFRPSQKASSAPPGVTSSDGMR
jgi:hypothetical protein